MPMKGNAKNAELFITAMIGPEITAKSTSGTGTAFHLGLIQAKVTWKINIPSKETYVNKTPPPPPIRDHIPTHTSMFTCAGSPT